MRWSKLLSAVAAGALWATWSCAALAQDYFSPTTEQQMVTISSTSLDSILHRLDALERAATGEADHGGWESVHDEGWSNEFGGRIMGDYVLFANQTDGSVARFGDLQNYMEFRRLRFFMQGEGYGVYGYKLEVDFEPETGAVDDPAVSLRDAYISISDMPFLGMVRMGHFKEPFSLEELTSSRYITFMERALPNIFAPARNVGIAAYNNTPAGHIAWQYGLFFNDVSDLDKERVSDNQGVNATGRVVWTPYYCEGGRYLVHIGGGATYADDRDDSVRWRSRPEVHEGPRFIDTGTITADDYYTANAELAVVWGRASLQGEAFYNRTRSVVGDLDFYGGYVYASFFLTGEHRNYNRAMGTFGRVRPYTNFWWVRTANGTDWGWGAWELAARYSYLELDDVGVTDTERGQMNDLTVGINWYWQPYSRFMLNWIHAFNDYEVAVGGNTEAQADILAMRLQVDF